MTDSRLIPLVLLIASAVPAFAQSLPSWPFDSPEDQAAWVANAHLGNVRLEGGILEADGIGSDPFFHIQGLSFPANAWQYVVLRIRADRPGNCDLFWSGTTEGQYGGLTEEKKNTFTLKGTGDWEEIVLFPFWQLEGTICQFRLDLIEGAHFGIDSISVLHWDRDAPLTSHPMAWNFAGDLTPWRVHPGATDVFGPPLGLSVAGRDWATVKLRSKVSGVGALLWATGSRNRVQSEEFEIRGDNRTRSYPVELAGLTNWQDPLLAIGIRLPSVSPELVYLESIEIADRPTGPAELAVRYFGFENAPNRAGKPCRLLVHLSNEGAETAPLRGLSLEVPPGLEILETPPLREDHPIGFAEVLPFAWVVQAEKPGDYPVRLLCEGKEGTRSATAILNFSASLGLPPTDTVPAPSPVETSIDVCAYYFPGWSSAAKWDCIRDTAPIRKPVLGYYDESRVECVDWQIKWAAENGIDCFLVDWYWIQGQQYLTHWFEAYRQARYRDHLGVALMWANHNPAGSHSREDWRAVTREWIEHYFTFENYYRIEGMPAVFLWDPRLIRSDLGGSQEVRTAFEESQQMAREAGYPGIRFLAMFDHDSPEQAQRLLEEGYFGATNYHEWGQAAARASSTARMAFEDVVATASETWSKRNRDCGDLRYYPLVETGWDSRPWHGKKAQVIAGRTADLFERLLADGKSFCEQHAKPFVVLGPVNEWGEGSYIEPCTEFGFEMMEMIRKVFGLGNPRDWPVNVAPSDVGLGPYDFPPVLPATSWSFEQSPEGWEAMMNVADFRAEEGALRFRAVSSDPALTVSTSGLRAAEFKQLRVRMSVQGESVPERSIGQIFWAPNGAPSSEATSLLFDLPADGRVHDVEIDLSGHPRWHGRIDTLRFDPTGVEGAEVILEEFRFE